MNILQFLGAILYTVSLVKLIAGINSGKQEKLESLVPCLASGIILCSANGGLNLKIAVSLSIFAALLIGIPSIYLNKKGER